MAVRLLEMQRILKPTGSIYLHCDPTQMERGAPPFRGATNKAGHSPSTN